MLHICMLPLVSFAAEHVSLLKTNLMCSFQILDAQAALLVLDSLLLPVPQNVSFKHATSHTHARGLCPMRTPLHVLQQLSHLLLLLRRS